MSNSLEDFILAYIGAMHGWGVVSYDRDLLTRIHDYLIFDAYLPGEVSHLPANAMVLLDTNILNTYVDRKPRLKLEITTMITENPDITFLLSQHIIDETQRLRKKKTWSFKDEISVYLDPAEADLAEFVEDFEGFQSHHKSRHKRKGIQRHKKKSHKDRTRGKWGKYLD